MHEHGVYICICFFLYHPVQVLLLQIFVQPGMSCQIIMYNVFMTTTVSLLVDKFLEIGQLKGCRFCGGGRNLPLSSPVTVNTRLALPRSQLVIDVVKLTAHLG